MVLEAKDLTFRYPRQRGGPVLDRVSLTLRSGEGMTHPFTRALWRALPRNEFTAGKEALGP